MFLFNKWSFIPRPCNLEPLFSCKYNTHGIISEGRLSGSGSINDNFKREQNISGNMNIFNEQNLNNIKNNQQINNGKFLIKESKITIKIFENTKNKYKNYI